MAGPGCDVLHGQKRIGCQGALPRRRPIQASGNPVFARLFSCCPTPAVRRRFPVAEHPACPEERGPGRGSGSLRWVRRHAGVRQASRLTSGQPPPPGANRAVTPRPRLSGDRPIAASAVRDRRPAPRGALARLARREWDEPNGGRGRENSGTAPLGGRRSPAFQALNRLTFRQAQLAERPIFRRLQRSKMPGLPWPGRETSQNQRLPSSRSRRP